MHLNFKVFQMFTIFVIDMFQRGLNVRLNKRWYCWFFYPCIMVKLLYWFTCTGIYMYQWYIYMHTVGIVRGMLSKACVWEHLPSLHFPLTEIFARACEYMLCWTGLRCCIRLLVHVYDNGKWNVWFLL